MGYSFSRAIPFSTTARVRVNPKSRDQDDGVKPERIPRVIEHRYRVAERPSVQRAIAAESAV